MRRGELSVRDLKGQAGTLLAGGPTAEGDVGGWQ